MEKILKRATIYCQAIQRNKAVMDMQRAIGDLWTVVPALESFYLESGRGRWANAMKIAEDGLWGPKTTTALQAVQELYDAAAPYIQQRSGAIVTVQAPEDPTQVATGNAQRISWLNTVLARWIESSEAQKLLNQKRMTGY